MDIEFFIWITAIPLLVHLTFVHINLGTSVSSFIAKYVYRDDGLAKKLAKVAVAGEFVSGTLGTVLTVILAGIWTPLMNVAANILYIPLLIALIGIVLRLPSIGGYWYTLDRGGTINFIFGISMIIGGFLIPFGFRYIFAFINYPMGLESLNPLKGDIFLALLNPLFPPLYILTLGSVLMIGFTICIPIVRNEEYHGSLDIRFIFYGLLATSLFIIGNIWFVYGLSSYSGFILTNLLSIGNPSFYTFLLMWISVIALSGVMALELKGGVKVDNAVYIAIPIIAMLSMEFSYDYSRFPYFVVIGDTGIDAVSFLNLSISAGIPEIGGVFLALMSMVIISIVGVYLLIIKRYFEG